MRPLLQVTNYAQAARVSVRREREARLRDVGDEQYPGRVNVDVRAASKQQRHPGHDHFVVPGHVVARVQELPHRRRHRVLAAHMPPELGTQGGVRVRREARDHSAGVQDGPGRERRRRDREWRAVYSDSGELHRVV
uniref:Uncharacterized protein n=1 Tax=Arundo donax TaxID=35708 RepID=A0A0A9AL19_ARUDO